MRHWLLIPKILQNAILYVKWFFELCFEKRLGIASSIARFLSKQILKKHLYESRILRFLGFIILIISLVSCGSREGLAPVDEAVWTPLNLHATTYRVKRGDTLYSIAFRYDADYKQLAKINNIRFPYHLAVGQIINLHTPKGQAQPKIRRIVKRNPPPAHRYKATIPKWCWPIQGSVKTYFAPGRGNKGINIAARKGSRVRAAQSGVVAYAGNGLENYGNLIIIKHSNNYLTAYGNNSRIIVKEGQSVSSGEVIADVGVINRNYYGLHFEIRKNGKPINPLLYLRKLGAAGN